MVNNIQKHKKIDENLVVTIPNVGLGTARTTTSYIVLFASIEGNRSEQIMVLASALEELGIKPEELSHYGKHPDCMLENAFEEWKKQGEELRTENHEQCKHDWVDDAGGGFDHLKYCRICFDTAPISSPQIDTKTEDSK